MAKSKKRKIWYTAKKINDDKWGIFIRGSDSSIAATRLERTARDYCDRLNTDLSDIDEQG